MTMTSRSDDDSSVIKLIAIALFVIGVCVGGGMYGCPQYSVYSQRLEGEAELAKAEYSKRVAVQTAQAAKDSATLLADAEVLRAIGVAKANAIIGDSLKDNEAYLRYLFINELANTKNQVIYVPTEAQLPILEAGKRPQGIVLAPGK
jgi:regulator of protease activity HflC (stomatin/prohibitin superfamily)